MNELVQLGTGAAVALLLTGMWMKWQGGNGARRNGEEYVRVRECRELCDKHHECLDRLAQAQTTQTEILRSLSGISNAMQIELAKISAELRR